jgi:hypothetical protein
MYSHYRELTKDFTCISSSVWYYCCKFLTTSNVLYTLRSLIQIEIRIKISLLSITRLGSEAVTDDGSLWAETRLTR